MALVDHQFFEGVRVRDNILVCAKTTEERTARIAYAAQKAGAAGLIVLETPPPTSRAGRRARRKGLFTKFQWWMLQVKTMCGLFFDDHQNQHLRSIDWVSDCFVDDFRDWLFMGTSYTRFPTVPTFVQDATPEVVKKLARASEGSLAPVPKPAGFTKTNSVVARCCVCTLCWVVPVKMMYALLSPITEAGREFMNSVGYSIVAGIPCFPVDQGTATITKDILANEGPSNSKDRVKKVKLRTIRRLHI